MKKLVFAIISVALLIFVSGCMSSTKLTIRAYDTQTMATSQKIISYETFWKAMENADFGYLEEQAVSDDEKRFAEALKLVINGDFTNAENICRELCADSEDSLITKYSEDMLGSILFFQSKWTGLLELDSMSIKEDEDSDIILVEAFNECPEETYSYPSQPTSLQTSFTMGGNPVVEVEVNGHKKKFWIDTGAGLSVVASDVAEECEIHPIGSEEAEAGTATSKKVAIWPAIIKEFKIGDIVINNHPVIIINKKDLEITLLGFIKILKIDGIIGWNAIQNMDIEIDYVNKITTIKAPKNFDNPERNFFWLDYPVVILRTEDGIPLNFGLDTGARRSHITENIFKKIDPEGMQSKEGMSWSAGGFEKRESQVISDLTLILNGYSLHFEKIETTLSQQALFIELDGVLGSDIAKNGSIKIDYSNGILNLKLTEATQ